jgi:hypothetical protein
MECGEPLTEAHIAPGTVYGPTQTERKLMKDPRWMRVYALLTWIVGVVLALISLGIGLHAAATGQQSRAMYALVTAMALLMSNILMGNGLWNFKRWGLKGAISVHGTLLFYLIAQLVRAVWNPEIPYLDGCCARRWGCASSALRCCGSASRTGGCASMGGPIPKRTGKCCCGLKARSESCCRRRSASATCPTIQKRRPPFSTAIRNATGRRGARFRAG